MKDDLTTAATFFERAVTLDPNFAMAYTALGTTYTRLGKAELGTENIRKAYELRDRVSERERFSIITHYESIVTGNLDAVRKTEELWFQIYPRDSTAATYLGATYATVGDYGRAVVAYQKALEIDPEDALAYGGLVFSNLNLYRLDQAKTIARQAREHKLDSPQIHYALHGVSFVQQDVPGMERELAELIKDDVEELALHLRADTAAFHGQYKRARELTREAVRLAERSGGKGAGADYEAEAALRDALVGNTDFGNQQANSAIRSFKGRDAQAIAALALAVGNNSAQLTRLVEDLSARFPADTIVQSEYLPMIRAGKVLKTRGEIKKSSAAITDLAAAEPYEFGSCAQGLNFSLYPAYVRGQLYLAAHEPALAVAEFQKIVDHSGVVVNEPIGSLAYLGLARAYRLGSHADSTPAAPAESPLSSATSGDRGAAEASALEKSMAAYEKFFALWAQADPDIPILIQARQEYRQLKNHRQ